MRRGARAQRRLASRVAPLLLAGLRFTTALGPTHLIVLQHGLSGTAVDLAFLKERLDALAGARGARVRVHCAASNVGRTADGVAAGGARLAAEVLEVAAACGPSLAELSLVGNSLGGIYARYAARELADGAGATVARGLRPRALVTLATPHLGVRRFTWLPLPRPLHALAPALVGRTGAELFLRDGGGGEPPLLVRLACDDGFARPLGAFARRIAFANVAGDFMVPFGTAAIDARRDDWPGFADGPGVASGYGAPASAARRGPILFDVDVPPASSAAADAAAAWSHEERMAASLNELSWRKVGVRFDSTSGPRLPLAHNKLAALRREGWRRALLERIEGTSEGAAVMEHAADLLLDDAS
jgi:hypothetical protein